METHNAPDPAAPVRWAELTWQDVAATVDGGMDMAILPVGATEQHGPHLHLGMDTMAAVAVADGASALTGVPVLPEIAVGCSLGHTTRWPGTLSLRPATLTRVVCDMAEWLVAAGIRRLLILNGHVTNHAPLRCALEEIRHEHREMLVALRSIWEISPQVHAAYQADAVNFHANAAETSMVLALRPDLVHLDRAVDEPDRARGGFFAHTVDRETPTGTVGRPSLASAEYGRRLLALAVTQLAHQVRQALDEAPPLAPELFSPIPTARKVPA